MTQVNPEELQAPPAEDPQDQALPLDPEQRESDDEVEETSDQSFPASDPPSYTRSTTAD